jgi:hypothetical protein
VGTDQLGSRRIDAHSDPSLPDGIPVTYGPNSEFEALMAILAKYCDPAAMAHDQPTYTVITQNPRCTVISLRDGRW